MTISSEISQKRYIGNDVTTVFPYNYKINDESHIEAIISDANDENIQTLVLNTDYSITGVGEEGGGNLTYPISGSALPAGWSITITRKIPLTQLTDLINQGGFFAETHEDVFDYLTMMAQQQQEELDRAAKVSKTSGLTGDDYITEITGYVADAEAAASAAQAAQTAAETAQTNAETAETNAETAETGALAAQTAAETAQTNAETAQTAAELAETNAETAQTAAELAETNAETAQTAAELAETNAAVSEGNAAISEANASGYATIALDSKNAAQTAQTNAETAETNAETAQTAAELAETNAETAQTAAEAARDLAQDYANDLEINTHESVGSVGQTYVDISGFVLATSLDNVECFIDGVKQAKSTLTRTSDTRLTLGGALSGGESIEIRSASFNPSATAEAAASASAASIDASAAASSASAAAQSALDAESFVGNFENAPVVIKTDSYTLTASDKGKLLTMDAATVKVFTLPDIVGEEVYMLKNIGEVSVTITPHASDETEVEELAVNEVVIITGDLTNSYWRLITSHDRLTDGIYRGENGIGVNLDDSSGLEIFKPIFHASYTTNVNGTFGEGVLTGTPIGGASVAGGYLELDQNDVRYVDYDAVDNTTAQKGAIEFPYMPNYSGSPATDNTLFVQAKAHGDTKNLIHLRHKSGGQIQFGIFDENGAPLFLGDIGAWSPTAATEYAFEIDFNIDDGESRVFIDGVQLGATQTGTGTRDASNTNLLRLGSNVSAADSSRGKFGSFNVYNSVQHVSNFTPDLTNVTEAGKLRVKEEYRLPGIEAGDAGKLAYVKTDESGYELTIPQNLPLINPGDRGKIAVVNAGETEYELTNDTLSTTNVIINPEGFVAQRGLAHAGIAATDTYYLDHWYFINNGTGESINVYKDTSDQPDNRFISHMRVLQNSTNGGGSGLLYCAQKIEGYLYRKFENQKGVLSFWVKSPTTGIYSVLLKNKGNDRSYLAEYTINLANTWELKSVFIDFNYSSGGTWDYNNDIGLKVQFNIQNVSEAIGAKNTWLVGNYGRTGNEVDFLATGSGANFRLTGIQLTLGKTVPPYDPRDLNSELDLCFRYFYRVNNFSPYSPRFGIGLGLTATQANMLIDVPTPLRLVNAPPTPPPFTITWSTSLGLYDGVNIIPIINIASGGANVPADYPRHISFLVTAAGLIVTSQTYFIFCNTNTAWIAFDAEL